MKSPLALLRELRAHRDVQTRTKPCLLGTGEDVDGPWPVCATCGETITGEGVTILCNGRAHHEECAPHPKGTAS